MADPSTSSTADSSEIERLRRELAEKSALVQSVRKELILSQISVLELQDTLLQKETDKADAVSILGQAELVLEGKINYIFELDRVLNERLTAAQRELAEARAAHDSVTNDLVQKLNATNRALAEAHQLAGNYARDAAQTGEKLTAARVSIQERETAIQRLETTVQERDSVSASLRSEIADLGRKLNSALVAHAALEQQLAAIHESAVWKLTAPFRSKRSRKS
jgi:chromosome segregation ATPase